MSLPPGLHVHEHFNPEEAAHAAAEFIGSLDNLSGEITFLLKEIELKDGRIDELINRINTRHYGLTKPRKDTNLPPGNAPFPLPLQQGQPLPTDHMLAKDAMALMKIQGEWTKVHALQAEKVKLAERMERIVNRAKERGKAEWVKVGGIDIEDLELDHKVFDMGGEVLLPPGGLGSGTDGRSQKKRKPNALPLPLPSAGFQNTIIHPPTSMPPPQVPLHRNPSTNRQHPPPHSGHSTREHGYGSRRADRERHYAQDDDYEVELDNDDGDLEAGDAEADTNIYCICQQRSHGAMIGCDGQTCKYEWFHLKCVDITPPLPDTWYCQDCVSKMGSTLSMGREKKGRKQR